MHTETTHRKRNEKTHQTPPLPLPVSSSINDPPQLFFDTLQFSGPQAQRSLNSAWSWVFVVYSFLPIACIVTTVAGSGICTTFKFILNKQWEEAIRGMLK